MKSYSHTDASYQARGASSSPHVPLVASVELATGARVVLVDLDSEGLDCLLWAGGMTIDQFAGIPVTDYAAALTWYERLLGSPPTFFPNDIEAELASDLGLGTAGGNSAPAWRRTPSSAWRSRTPRALRR